MEAKNVENRIRRWRLRGIEQKERGERVDFSVLLTAIINASGREGNSTARRSAQEAQSYLMMMRSLDPVALVEIDDYDEQLLNLRLVSDRELSILRYIDKHPDSTTSSIRDSVDAPDSTTSYSIRNLCKDGFLNKARVNHKSQVTYRLSDSVELSALQTIENKRDELRRDVSSSIMRGISYRAIARNLKISEPLVNMLVQEIRQQCEQQPATMQKSLVW